jgi:hypothetical protein
MMSLTKFCYTNEHAELKDISAPKLLVLIYENNLVEAYHRLHEELHSFLQCSEVPPGATTFS